MPPKGWRKAAQSPAVPPVVGGYRVPEKYLRRWNSALKSKSRKAAMDMFCLQCVGFERAEVRKCTAPGCPLYKWRPRAKDPEE